MTDSIHYVVVLACGIKLGIRHETSEEAEATAKRLRFRYYEVIPYRVTKNA